MTVSSVDGAVAAEEGIGARTHKREWGQELAAAPWKESWHLMVGVFMVVVRLLGVVCVVVRWWW